MLWLGMLQVKPQYHRLGIGNKILKFFEEYALLNNVNKVGIHTTIDNIPAQKLYSANNYELIEVGPCTNADGKERIGYTYTKILKK